MELALWGIGIALVVFIVIKYRQAKAKHQAAANAVFAKYTFEHLTEEDKTRVEKKANELCHHYEDELIRYGWYAVAMKSLSIPSAIPDNPNWYNTKTPNEIRPNEVMVKAVVTFINRNYDLDIVINGIESPKASKEIQEAVASLDNLDKSDQKA